MKNEIVKADEVNFHGQTLFTVMQDGTVYAAMKPIVKNMGLNWKSQYQKIKDSQRYGDIAIPLQTPGGVQEMLFLPAEELNALLFSINPEKVKPELKDLKCHFHADATMDRNPGNCIVIPEMILKHCKQTRENAVVVATN